MAFIIITGVNLSLIGAFTWITALVPYRVTTCRERELTLDHIHTFLTTQGHGEPPRMRDQLSAGATSQTTRTWKTIHTIHTPIHANKMNMKGWLWRPNDIRGLKLPDIFLTDEKKTPKTSLKKLVPTGDRTQARCVTGAHATASFAALNLDDIKIKINSKFAT